MIVITDFGAEAPRLDKRKLGNGQAQEATNVRLSSGNLEAWRGFTDVEAELDLGVVRSLYLYDDQHWFSSTDNVSYMASPIAQDQYDRVYFTSDADKPQVTSNLIFGGGDPKPVNSFDLGVQAPDTQITGVVQGSDTEPTDTSDDETRFYVMTYVTQYGEEGPPGPVSNELTIPQPSTQTVDLTLPILATNNQNITHKRIYRTITTGDSTDYYFVGEVPFATATLTDNLSSEQLGSPLETIDYDPPPENMQGLTMGVNGIAAGFEDNTVSFSEAYLPYAWPSRYRRTTEAPVVGIVPTTTGFVVATEGKPYVFSGSAPDSITERKLDKMQACVSKRSMVDMGAYAIYASPDGLVGAGEGRADLLTEDILKKREWEEFYPKTIHAYRYEELYIGFYGDVDDNGQGIGGFIYDPRTNEISRLDFYATVAYADLKTDKLYLVMDGDLRSWDTDPNTMVQYRWHSKAFKSQYTSYGAMKVFTDSPQDVAVQLIIDGEVRATLTDLTKESFRLPFVKGYEWEFILYGTASIQAVVIARTFQELNG